MTEPSPVRMLVLDDDPMVLRSLERGAAVRRDLVLATAATPSEARDLVLGANPPFDVVVCDFQLKAIGADVTSEPIVRELHGMGQPVIIMTADPDAARAAVGDLVPILAKPVALRELVASVRVSG